MEKIMLGIQTATAADVNPLTANDEDIVINKMYVKLNTNPIPIFSPIPPFIFLEEIEIPIDHGVDGVAEQE